MRLISHFFERVQFLVRANYRNRNHKTSSSWASQESIRFAMKNLFNVRRALIKLGKLEREI